MASYNDRKKCPHLVEVMCHWVHWSLSHLEPWAQRLTGSVMIVEVWPSSWPLQCGWDWTKCSPWICLMVGQPLHLCHFYLSYKESSFFCRSFFDHWNTQHIFKYKIHIQINKKDSRNVVECNEWNSLGRTAFILTVYFLAKPICADRDRWRLHVLCTLLCQIWIFWILSKEKSLSKFFAACSQSWSFTINTMPSKSGKRCVVTFLHCN